MLHISTEFPVTNLLSENEMEYRFSKVRFQESARRASALSMHSMSSMSVKKFPLWAVSFRKLRSEVVLLWPSNTPCRTTPIDSSNDVVRIKSGDGGDKRGARKGRE